jgi:hypothetical protein
VSDSPSGDRSPELADLAIALAKGIWISLCLSP